MSYKENLHMQLGISRVRSNVEGEYIEIQVKDNESSTRFLTLKLSLEAFAQAVTGLHGIDVLGTVRGLERVGKTLEMDTLTFEMPEDSRDKELAKELAEKNCPEGWVPDSDFVSRDSFYSEGDKYYARTTIRRWV